jgi:hypothetical protein
MRLLPGRELFDGDGEIHIRVDCAIELEGACGIEGSDAQLAVARDGLIADQGRTGFAFGACIAYRVPRTVGDHMQCRGIVDQKQVLTFMQGHSGLDEIGIGKMHLICVCGAGGGAAGGNKREEKRQACARGE